MKKGHAAILISGGIIFAVGLGLGLYHTHHYKKLDVEAAGELLRARKEARERRELTPVPAEVFESEEGQNLRDTLESPAEAIDRLADRGVSVEASVDNFIPEEVVAEANGDGPQLVPEPEPREQERPQVAATRAVIDSFRSLSDPQLSDPRSQYNQALTAKMIEMASRRKPAALKAAGGQ